MTPNKRVRAGLGAPRRRADRDRYTDCAGTVWVKKRHGKGWRPLRRRPGAKVPK